MDFNSKYKSSEIEEILNSVDGKQDELISGTNIKTINGESILGEGDLTIEGGAKVYKWFYDGESESVTLSQEEYDNIVEADIVVVNVGILSFTVSKSSKEFGEAIGAYGLFGQFDMEENKYIFNMVIEISTKLATITIRQQDIPTKTSQLENDSNFVTSDNLKTINGESILGSGDITISGGGGSSSGSGVEYVEAPMEEGPITSVIFNEMECNKIYVATMPISEVVILGFEQPSGLAAEYTLHFPVEFGGVMITLPNFVKTFNGSEYALVGEDGDACELSIVASLVNGQYVYKAVLAKFE